MGTVWQPRVVELAVIDLHAHCVRPVEQAVPVDGRAVDEGTQRQVHVVQRCLEHHDGITVAIALQEGHGRRHLTNGHGAVRCGHSHSEQAVRDVHIHDAGAGNSELRVLRHLHRSSEQRHHRLVVRRLHVDVQRV